ncbi:hypothetical protein WMY93_018212 [Mugilogobius chulae]|uniref:NHR domain-containing protein n=1 Tax=Mugilogobius chulae TaxID=88201 RepID=A0AAW0NJD1_9GOBI
MSIAELEACEATECVSRNNLYIAGRHPFVLSGSYDERAAHGQPMQNSEMVSMDCLRPRTYATHRASIQRSRADPRLSISLCDLSLQHQDEEDSEEDQPMGSSSCHVPQNSQNSQQCSLLPPHLDTDLHFHSIHGIHATLLDKHTVAKLDLRGDERTLVFTSRPMKCSETIYLKVTKGGGKRSGALSYGVTSCDPSTLRPSDLPCDPESLVDRKEFWAMCRVGASLHGGDILGFSVNAEGEVIMSHNGQSAGMQLCVDNSRPLWMFYGLHGISQLRILAHPSLHTLRWRGPLCSSVIIRSSCGRASVTSALTHSPHAARHVLPGQRRATEASDSLSWSCCEVEQMGLCWSSHVRSDTQSKK